MGIGVAIAAGSLQAIGAGVSAYDNYQQGRAEGRALDEQARLSAQQARFAYFQGQETAGRYRSEGTMVQGAQRAAAAAGGADVSKGSVRDALESTRVLSELDAIMSINNAAREAWGYKRQSLALEEQAKEARTFGTRRMWGSILGGLGSAGGFVAGRMG